MPSLTAFAQNKVLDAFLRQQPLVTPQVWFLGLVTTMGSSNALAGVEVQGGSYARVSVPASLAAWAGTQGQGTTQLSVGISGMTSNNARIIFPDPTDNWGSIVGWEMWDSLTFGNRWIYDRLLIPKTASVGDPALDFPAGELQISFS